MGARLAMSRGTLASLIVLALAGSALAQSGRVGGTVKNEGGQPIKGAIVTAENLDVSSVASETAITDDKGRFSMVGLKFGDWTFTVQASGYGSQMATMGVRTAGVNAPMAFVMRKIFVPPSALGNMAPKDVQMALAAADELYNNQRWDEAIAAYRGLLTQAPSLNVIHMQIGAAFRNEKSYDAAIAAYNDLLKVDPANEKAKLAIGMTNFEKGDLAAADQAVQAVAQTPGASRDAFYDLGDIKLALSQTDAAASAYQRAAETDRTWGKPVLALGRMAMTKGDVAGASKFFQTVITVDPISPEAEQAKTLLAQLTK
jgi:tetratricopeptide (TPR) repeat protein